MILRSIRSKLVNELLPVYSVLLCTKSNKREVVQFSLILLLINSGLWGRIEFKKALINTQHVMYKRSLSKVESFKICCFRWHCQTSCCCFYSWRSICCWFLWIFTLRTPGLFTFIFNPVPTGLLKIDGRGGELDGGLPLLLPYCDTNL